jgi:FkbM family methyltransferase
MNAPRMLLRVKQRLIIRTRWRRFIVARREIGLSAAFKYFSVAVIAPEIMSLHPRNAQHPVVLRGASSDREVFHQVFIERHYGVLDDLSNVRIVVDCGANVGYSAAYFLSQHPNCRVVAVEPDLGNFKMLERNMQPYGNRVQLVRAAIWSHAAPLRIEETPYRDGREWSRQVRMPRADESGGVDGIDVPSLLTLAGADRISILKVDIEGAEAVVFSSKYESWISKIDVIAIELHDDSTFGQASEVFFRAIKDRFLNVTKSGDLVVCRRVTGQ